jgi:hypothetical protein
MNAKAFVDDHVPKRVFELNGTRYLKNRKFYDPMPSFEASAEQPDLIIPRVKIDDDHDERRRGSTNGLAAEKPAKANWQSKSEIWSSDRFEKQNPMYKSDVESDHNDNESNAYHDPLAKFPSHSNPGADRFGAKTAELYETINDNDYHYLNPKDMKDMEDGNRLDEPKLTPIQLRVGYWSSILIFTLPLTCSFSSQIQQLKKDVFEEFLTVRVNLNELLKNIAIVCVFDRLW